MYYHATKDDSTKQRIARRRELMRMEEIYLQEQEEEEKKRDQNTSIQPKSDLQIGDPNDVHEHEADAVAKKVVSGNENNVLRKMSDSTAAIHRSHEEEKEGMLMAKSENGTLQGTEQLQAKIDSSKGGGQSLDTGTKSEMEHKMGADLSDVKIHTDSNAHQMAEGINAKAFTHGQDIYFKQGNYNTSSTQGKELLAHELTHTQQQKGGVARKKIQRQVDSVLKPIFSALINASPLSLLVKQVLAQWQSLPESEREKRMNQIFDKKIAGLKMLAGQEAPAVIKEASSLMSVMPGPSIETMWPFLISGELGYYEYLRNLSNKFNKADKGTAGKENETKAGGNEAPPPGMIENPAYKKGGYSAVLENQLKNMIDPDFMIGELHGFGEGFIGWFVDIGKMFGDLWDILISDYKKVAEKIEEYKNMAKGKAPKKELETKLSVAEQATLWLKKNSGLMVKFLVHLAFDKEARAQVAEGVKDAAMEAGKSLAYKAGAAVAKTEVSVLSMPAYEQGSKVGYVAGYILPEILLAVFTSSIGTWIKNGINAFRATRIGIKTLQAAKWLAEVGKSFITAFGRFGDKLRALTGSAFKGISEAFDAILDFFRRLMDLEKEVPEEVLNKGDDIADLNKGKPHEKPVEKETGKPKEKEEATKEEGSGEKKKTKGVDEDQLSEVGKNNPVPLTREELAKVNSWQNSRNAYLKKWRDMDFSKVSEKTKKFITDLSGDNAIRNHLTPDDIAAYIKEKRGIQIYDTNGELFNHIQEVESAMGGLKNNIQKLKKALNEIPLNLRNTPDAQMIQNKLADISNTLDAVRLTFK